MPVSYAYPNGTLFEIEKDWLIAAGIMIDGQGAWGRGNDLHHALAQPDYLGPGQEIITPHIGDFVQPERPEAYRLVDKDRLISILNAFRARTALPPCTAERSYKPSMNGRTGRGIVVKNGFHRFHASIIYGYSHLPVLIDKQVVVAPVIDVSTRPKYVPPGLRDKK